MLRRDFLKAMAATAVTSGLVNSRNLLAQESDYLGKFLVTIQVEGGWDIVSFCDPKMNVPGELEINHWARDKEIQQAGNIRYAPFYGDGGFDAGNEAFFQKYYDRMLVINGVDAQTNSHTAGVTHNWSGRLADGFPTITSLFAGAKTPSFPLAYIANGGYSFTGDVIRSTRLEDPGPINNILNPNSQEWDLNTNYLQPNDWQKIEALRLRTATKMVNNPSLSERQLRNRRAYLEALESSALLKNFSATVEASGDLPEGRNENGFWSTLELQSKLAVMAFSSGVSSSADLQIGGFDTHQNHDWNQGNAMRLMTEGIDALWNYAEEYGVADRLVVLIGSDFSRTPHYNDDNGKDHWPIGGYVIMEKGVNWTNRMVGYTDEGHFASRINPSTLQVDETNGTYIYPKHVMRALRKYLGIDVAGVADPFPLNTEDFDFFNGSKSTPQMSDPRNSLRV